MKKFLTSFLAVFTLINLGLAVSYAEGLDFSGGDYDPDATYSDDPLDFSGTPVETPSIPDASPTTPTEQSQPGTAIIPLPDAGDYSSAGLPTPPGGTESGQELVAIAIQTIVQYAKVLASVVAVLFIIFMGVRLVTSGGNEENIKKATTGLIYSILALAIISVAEQVGEIVGFFPDLSYQGTSTGGILEPGNTLLKVGLFDRQVDIVMVFIRYMIGVIAVLMLVINGAKLVGGGGEEENVKKARNGIVYSLFGLLLFYLGDIFINKVFYVVSKESLPTTGVEPTVNIERGVEEIVGITNFIVSFIGPLLMLLILVGGVMYITAGGEEENMNKAKRLIIAALIGVIVIYGAFGIVSTVVSGYFIDPAGVSAIDPNLIQ
jgi:hypothetical protein